MQVPFDIPPLKGPSGRTLTYADFALIREIEAIRMVAWSEKDIPFHSGFLSRVYVQGRNDLSNKPSSLRRVCVRIKEAVEALPFTHGPQKCLIGIPTAGTQLAQGVSMLSDFEEVLHMRPSRVPPICFSSLRSKLKNHGKDGEKWIGDADLSSFSYITLENVVSTAAGMLEHFEHLEGEGYPVKEMHHVVFADWELGGMETLHARGIRHVHTLYVMRDVMAALVHMGVWPQERRDEMERRIRDWHARH